MTTQVITGGELNRSQYTGEAGNRAIYDGYFKASAASTGTDTEIDLFTIPQGAKITNFSAVWTAQGTGGTGTVGWKYKNGQTGGTATALLGSTSTAAAGTAGAYFIPPALTAAGSSGNATGIFDDDIIIYAHLTGAAMPQGMEIYAMAEGAYVGTR